MKIHIHSSSQQAIGNYKSIIVESGQISPDIDQVSRNECEEILANDILDNFSISDFSKIIQIISSKLRLGGRIVIGGTSLRLFCHHVICGLISEEESSNIIMSKKSMSEPLRVTDFLSNLLGLQIQSTQMNGIHYEITAIRSK